MLALATASTGAVAAAPSPTGSSNPVITPDRAQQVVAEWFARSYQAGAGLDSALLADAESPPLLTIDEGDFQFRRAVDKPFENLIEEPAKVDVYVPRQTMYPAQFLARIGYAGGASQYFVFVSESADRGWLTPFQAGTDGFPKLASPIALDADGYATLVPADAAKLKLGLDAIPRRLVDYFSEYQAQALPPAKPFRDGPATSDNLKAIRARTREIDAEYAFSVVPSPHAAYRTKDGGALTFFAYSSQEKATAPRGATLRVRPSGFPGPELPSGRYLGSDTTRMTLIAAAVPSAKQRKGLVTVVGRYTGTLSTTGVPEDPTEA